MLHIAALHQTELCVAVSIQRGRADLRSATRGDLNATANKGTTHGRRCCAVSGPTTWNTISLSIREQFLTLEQFRRRLKAKQLIEHITLLS